MKPITIMILILGITGQALAAPGNVEKSFAAPYSCPTGMVSDGKYLYLADRKSDKIYVLDPESGEVTRELASPGYQPEGLAFDGDNLWLVDSEESVLLQIDPNSGKTIKTISCPAPQPRGLAWDGQYLWLADARDKKLLQVSTEDGTTIKQLSAPSNNPTGLAYDGVYLWAADRGSNRIYMIWPQTGEVIMMFKAPSEYAWGLAYLDNKLYCADYQADSIYTIAVNAPEIQASTDPVAEIVEYTHQFRNYGPGIVTDLNIYLAIPEDSPHQKLLAPPIFSSAVNYDILTDQWGQKVARFHFDRVNSGEMAQASYRALARIYDQCFYIRPEKAAQLKDMPKDIAKDYLVNDTKFALDSDIIRAAVKKAIGDETNPYWMMRKIFRYIIDNMYYELAGGWNIAPAVLERGNGSCSEYSFVFIAMCRAAGLPARYAGSIAQRGDLASEDEVFHRWCEVYLPKIGWVPIDPSGGDQATPEGQANYIGHVANRYLITTGGGGGSEYLGWEYNSYETYQSEGVCKIHSEKLGEWSPADTTKKIDLTNTLEPAECRPK